MRLKYIQSIILLPVPTSTDLFCPVFCFRRLVRRVRPSPSPLPSATDQRPLPAHRFLQVGDQAHIPGIQTAALSVRKILESVNKRSRSRAGRVELPPPPALFEFELFPSFSGSCHLGVELFCAAFELQYFQLTWTMKMTTRFISHQLIKTQTLGRKLISSSDGGRKEAERKQLDSKGAGDGGDDTALPTLCVS
ncbi:hypothetical protein AVEN_9113-1 [Araneus ventricosus]|uniref:Uncharacterized protein n=1 Tax=Araneus ventricosus TaxID=182803 RepID=A0A4Y2PB81_ARAVE|nr:hypothetical protein AVEN_9113-1 [Araneus ventricosus]